MMRRIYIGLRGPLEEEERIRHRDEEEDENEDREREKIHVPNRVTATDPGPARYRLLC